MLKRLWLLFAQTVTIAVGVVWTWEAVGPERAPAEAVTRAPATPGAAPAPVPHVMSAADTESILSAAVDRAAPAVVNIFTRRDARRDEAGADAHVEHHVNPLGSGVVVTSDGYILTNYHVVEGISNPKVALPDGKTYAARIVGTDAETDLALLRVDATGLAAIAMGDSTALRVGAPVLAIGNPFDVGQTVTAGIVSALGRHGLGLNNYEDFIQTDAAINQGNSGGALVDLEGRLIGINTAIFSPDLSEGFVGIGFAIPTSIIERVLPSLMAGERVKRGYLGFVPQQLSDELARDLGLSVTSGIVVRQVIPESPALAAGLRARDVVLSIDDVPAVRVNRVLQRIAEIPPGKTVAVEVLRGQKRVRLSIKASVRPLGALEKESLPPAYDEESAPEDAPEH